MGTLLHSILVRTLSFPQIVESTNSILSEKLLFPLIIIGKTESILKHLFGGVIKRHQNVNSRKLTNYELLERVILRNLTLFELYRHFIVNGILLI